VAKAEKAKNDKYIDICERNGIKFFCTVGYETGGYPNLYRISIVPVTSR
jgi:hypothetical protein